jgi:ABC-type nickel/cobalt efflux system permease component RcnA
VLNTVIAFLSIIALGFFLGMRHATDPDHVIAVTTIVSRERKISKAALIGVFWGAGHTLTIFVVGAAIILFGVVIPPRLGLSMELSVGAMLIVLGVMNVVSFVRSLPTRAQTGYGSETLHSHAHSHGDYIHTHHHGHQPETHQHSGEETPVAWLDRALQRFKLYRPIRPLIVGIVHGLAGSAAAALLVLATIRDPRWAVAYLLVFGAGTIAGMMLITMSIASAFQVVSGGRKFFYRLALASGLLSLAFGLVVAYQILVVNGLLTGHPHWVAK